MNITLKDLKIKQLRKKDMIVAQQLYLLFQQAFDSGSQSTAPVDYLEKLLKRPGFLCFAATYKKQVIGGLTAYELPMYYSESSELFIYDIAVEPNLQKKGIGKALLNAAKAYARQNNIQVLFVDASEQDINALDFYRSTGGTEEKVSIFSYGV